MMIVILLFACSALPNDMFASAMRRNALRGRNRPNYGREGAELCAIPSESQIYIQLPDNYVLTGKLEHFQYGTRREEIHAFAVLDQHAFYVGYLQPLDNKKPHHNNDWEAVLDNAVRIEDSDPQFPCHITRPGMPDLGALFQPWDTEDPLNRISKIYLQWPNQPYPLVSELLPVQGGLPDWTRVED